MKNAAILGFFTFFLLLSSCARGPKEKEAPPPPFGSLRLATTTSTENTGLLEVLLPPFERQYRTKVEVIAVGTGKALALGRNGDVDCILVHARAREDDFVAKGHGVNRRDVMYNDFVILGPAADPVGIKGCKDAATAMKKIAAAKAFFVSRGDDSGTHTKERNLWKAAGLAPSTEGWYLSIGQGMSKVLAIADEKRGYSLSDRGTFLAFKKKIELAVLVEGDSRLFNPYGVISVNPARYPKTNYHGAMALTAWLTSPEGQARIAGFKVEGEALFNPNSGD